MKRSKILLISAILSTVYFIYLISYFSGNIASSEGAEALGAGIAAALVAPHMICVGIAVIFNWIGFAMKISWAALTAGILYAVSMVLMFIYFFFVILQTVLCFLAYAKMKKAQKNQV